MTVDTQNKSKSRSIDLVWIVVDDFDQAIEFFTQKIGFVLDNRSDEMGWAELLGTGGSRLGIARKSEFTPINSGSNAVVTITVDDISISREELKRKGVNLKGEIMEIPGEVKMQMFSDNNGNLFQLVQLLS
ncbi:MAG: VOC family protein [Parachlamydiales bacterium]|jgi:predicted enzyme related to lactoylglutathione lyase